ncbi:MAG: type II toxin-antitoxin system RelE/ParE family toxin [Pirellulales bacterium]
MSRIDFAPEAHDDLVGIADFIGRDKPEAARSWIRKIGKTCETIASHPEMGESREGFGVPGCRSFSVGNYVIFFRSTADGIEVARIVHGNRDMRNI